MSEKHHRQRFTSLTFAPLTAAGNLKGFATIKMDPLTIADSRGQQPNQRAYVSAPQLEYYDADGRREIQAVVSIRHRGSDGYQAILEAWDSAVWHSARRA